MSKRSYSQAFYSSFEPNKRSKVLLSSETHYKIIDTEGKKLIEARKFNELLEFCSNYEDIIEKNDYNNLSKIYLLKSDAYYALGDFKKSRIAKKTWIDLNNKIFKSLTITI